MIREWLRSGWTIAFVALALTTVGCGDDDGMDPDAGDAGDAMVGMPGITVTPVNGLRTTEAGGQDEFTVVLDAQPNADVTIALSSSNAAEGTVSPTDLTFTPDNWNAPQTVTVTGVDDVVADGDTAYQIVTAPAVSSDMDYDGLDAADVEVTNTDDESPGVTIDPTEGLTTTEGGDTATFTVVLNARPTGDVTIPLSSSDEGEGTVSPAELTFTPDNFDAPQTVTVTGVDDAAVDGDQAYMIVTGAATSTDSGYDGFDADDVSVTNIDDESAGFMVDPIDGLMTTEAGGTATLTVVLNSAPTADVTVPVSSSDTSEGTVSPDTLTFTPDNWDAPQMITVTGVDDSVQDGPQVYNVVLGAASSTDTDYDGVDPADAEVTNTDDDSAGFTVTPVDGLMTTEAGGTATYTVVLNSLPTADVAIGVSSSDITEGTVSPDTLTFTTDNWNAPQTVTVTGEDDSVQDGNQIFMITNAAATSADSDYDGLDPADVEVTNVDDDSAGVTVTPPDGLTTTEGGGSDTFTIVLNSRPTASVLFTIASDDTSEGTALPANLTFTTDNWNAPQTITVTGEDDSVQDGDQVYSVLISAATSPDPDYDGIDPADVGVTNVDDDSAGVTVSPTSGLQTTEAGGSADFTVVLNSRPTDDVTFPIASSDTSEGTVSTASITFTTDNWNAPQTVTVTGEDDPVADGPQPYTVTVGAATSTDGDYDAFDPDDVSLSNVDNDSAGISVTPTSGLTTTEAGGTATFDVVLNSQPSADVSMMLSSSNTLEGTISDASLTFTNANWNAPQTVTITGVADSVFDGDQPYTIVIDAATSTDLDYDGIDPTDVSVTNLDNDPGVNVSPISGLITTEAGDTATFTVVLNVAPTADVFIPLASSDSSEGTVSPSSLQFTPSNWDAPQTVTITGRDDLVADGDQPYTIITSTTSSTQPGYNGLLVDDVSVTNEDDETAGFVLSRPRPRETTEIGGVYTMRIRLRSMPLADVTVPLESSDTSEGTISPLSLTFTSANWDAFQTVTVTGVNDAIADGNQPYFVRTLPAMSTDPSYDMFDGPDTQIINIDDETAGFEVAPLSVITREDGTATPTFRVRLRSEPTADVVVPVASDDTSEGDVDQSSLTFTDLNWDAFQTVTVTGADDPIADGDQSYTIVLGGASSADLTYDGLDPADVSATNVDNDSPGVTVSPTTGLVTTEAGGTADFDVQLDSQPTADVTIPIVSNDPGEGTLSASSLTFTSTNWNAPQTVTITGVDDFLADGDQGYVIALQPASSADGGYDGLNPPDVGVTNNDDETAGVTVTPTSGLSVSESGGSDTFTIVLDSQPTADVTIGLSSSDTGEGSVLPTSVTFTAANWNAPQTVTVTGGDDFVADGDQTFFAVTAAASSADSDYNGLSVDDVEVTCVDDETAGVTVTAPVRLNTSEAGGIDTFTIVLNSQPTAPVVIGVSSSDPTEGSVSPTTLTFTAANWNAPQTVTVTGEDDFVADGAQNYVIITAATMSADLNYMGQPVDDVPARNRDNETAGISVSPTGPLLTNEAGTVTDTFTVVLDSQPLNDVTIPFTSTDASEGDTTVASVTFTSGNWNMPQTVTVQGADDFVADGNQTFSIDVGPSTSADSSYMGLTGSSVSIVNLDDETPGFTVLPGTDLITSEDGLSDTFTVVLNSQPTGDVVINFTWDTTEGDVTPSSLTFTSTTWNMPQTVTVDGVDDTVMDGSQAYNVVGDPSGSVDAAYAALPPFNKRVICIDND